MTTLVDLDVLPGGARESFRRLNISERKGYRLAAQGAFPFMVRVGNTWIVPRRAFERFLAGELQAPNESAAPAESR